MTDNLTERSIADAKEWVATHVIDRRYKLPEQGIDYRALIGLEATLADFTALYGAELGLKSAAAQIDLPSESLRVVAHMASIKQASEEGTVIDFIDGLAEDIGLVVPSDESEDSALPEAS